MQKQNYVCAICFNPEIRVHRLTQTVTSLSVDHCHKTGKVRGLLCHSCNTALGLLKDNTDVMRLAINYLETNK